MTKHKKLRTMIAAMTATAVLYAMPAGFAAEAQMQNVPATETSAQTSSAAAQTAPAHKEIQTARPFAVVRVDKKWGAVAPSGNLTIPAEYDQITSYSADAVAVRQGKKWGVVRLDGTVIVV